MTSEVVSVVLGPEWDLALRAKLFAVLRDMDALQGDHWWGVGGSQELERWELKLDQGTICVEAETYVGLKIVGPEHLVSEIQKRLI